MKLSRPDTDALRFIQSSGEVMKRGLYWGTMINRSVEDHRMQRLEKRGLVKIDRVGESSFAKITERAGLALGTP